MASRFDQTISAWRKLASASDGNRAAATAAAILINAGRNTYVRCTRISSELVGAANASWSCLRGAAARSGPAAGDPPARAICRSALVGETGPTH